MEYDKEKRKTIRSVKKQIRKSKIQKAALAVVAPFAWIIQITFSIPGFILYYFGVYRKKIGIAFALFALFVNPFKEKYVDNITEITALPLTGYFSSAEFWESVGVAAFLFISTAVVGMSLGNIGAFVLNHTALGFKVDDAMWRANARKERAECQLKYEVTHGGIMTQGINRFYWDYPEKDIGNMSR